MITMGEFMSVINYRITEGSNYLWSCYGPNAYSLDSWNGDNDDGHSFCIIFDTKTQTVYEVQAHDYKRSRAYRLFNPLYIGAVKNESAERDIDFDEAWDCVKYVTLETVDDWLEKAKAIVSDEEYDTRVSVPLELDDKELFELMKQAHKNDVTLNDYVQRVLHSYIMEYEVNPRRFV